MHSLILTVHNKDFLLKDSLDRIKKYTAPPYELIIILDGCVDKSEEIALTFKKNNPTLKILISYAPDIFETKANNIGLKLAESNYSIIIQDDMLINESNWNTRLSLPFKMFDDIFAVSANCSHNWIFNENTKHLNMKEDLEDCWCDIINHVDHAGRAWGLSRDTLAVRQTCNRGPLMISNEDIQKLTQKVAYLNTVVDFLDRTIRIIVNRTYTIKNAIEWRRFTSGAV